MVIIAWIISLSIPIVPTTPSTIYRWNISTWWIIPCNIKRYTIVTAITTYIIDSFTLSCIYTTCLSIAWLSSSYLTVTHRTCSSKERWACYWIWVRLCSSSTTCTTRTPSCSCIRTIYWTWLSIAWLSCCLRVRTTSITTRFCPRLCSSSTTCTTCTPWSITIWPSGITTCWIIPYYTMMYI